MTKDYLPQRGHFDCSETPPNSYWNSGIVLNDLIIYIKYTKETKVANKVFFFDSMEKVP